MMLTTKQAADRLGMKLGTLEAWRHRGGGPEYCKFSKAVRYSEEAIDAFIASNKRTNTSQQIVTLKKN